MIKILKKALLLMTTIIFALIGTLSLATNTYASNSAGMICEGGQIRWWTESTNKRPDGWKYDTKAWKITIIKKNGDKKTEKTVTVYKDGSSEAKKGGYVGFKGIDKISTIGYAECRVCDGDHKYNGKACVFCGIDGKFAQTATNTENIIEIETLEKLSGWNLKGTEGEITYIANAIIEYRYKETNGTWNYNRKNHPKPTETQSATKKQWKDLGGTVTDKSFEDFFNQDVKINGYTVWVIDEENRFDLNKITLYTVSKNEPTKNIKNKEGLYGWADKDTKAYIKSEDVKKAVKTGYNVSSDCQYEVKKVNGTSYIYLKATPWTHKVEYNLNGGEGSTPTGFTKTYGIDEIINARNPVWAGRTFKGWKGSLGGKRIYKKGDKYQESFNGGTDTLTAQWEKNIYTLKYDPNGGDGTPQNSTPTKTGDNIVIIGNPFTNGDSKFVGWSTDPGAKEPEFKPGDTIPILDIAIEHGVQYEPTATIPLYAIWDAVPRISAEDRYFSLEDANNGKITPEELFKNASAYDSEDGNLAVGTNFYMENYTSDFYTKMNHNGSITETFVAVDSAGNKTKKMITVHIADTAAKDSVLSEDNQYVRAISLKYLDASVDDCGLMENSYWRALKK